jgi:hypothetical protein
MLNTCGPFPLLPALVTAGAFFFCAGIPVVTGLLDGSMVMVMERSARWSVMVYYIPLLKGNFAVSEDSVVIVPHSSAEQFYCSSRDTEF